jgi:ubiquinone biosynthesis protein COQ4
MHALTILEAPLPLRVWNTLRAMKRLNQNPADRSAQKAFMLSADATSLRRMQEFLETTSDGRRLLLERPVINALNYPPAKLLAMPAGSFGRALGEMYVEWKLEPFGAPEVSPRTALDYVSQRIADTHDCLHVATGYGASPIGEVELHTFMWAQSRRPTAIIVTIFGVAMSVLKWGPLKVIQRVRAAYRRGKKARRLDDVWWEALMDQPFEDVVARLSL